MPKIHKFTNSARHITAGRAVWAHHTTGAAHPPARPMAQPVGGWFPKTLGNASRSGPQDREAELLNTELALTQVCHPTRLMS
jgi:hypothetical protein